MSTYLRNCPTHGLVEHLGDSCMECFEETKGRPVKLKANLTAMDEGTVLTLLTPPEGWDPGSPLDTYHIAEVLGAYVVPTYELLRDMAKAGKIKRIGFMSPTWAAVVSIEKVRI